MATGISCPPSGLGSEEAPGAWSVLTTYRLLFAENLLNERIALLTGQLRIGFFFVSHRDQPRGIILAYRYLTSDRDELRLSRSFLRCDQRCGIYI
jgi:hypothetical protein